MVSLLTLLTLLPAISATPTSQTHSKLKAFETFLDASTSPGPNRSLGGVSAVAVDAHGITYSYSSGTRSVDPDSPVYSEPFTLDTTMWIASSTKLVTSIAGLQLVEQGVIDLDEDAGKYIQSLAEKKVFTGFVDGKPVYKERKNKITLRELLSHTAGLGYREFDEELLRESEYRGINASMEDINTYIDMPVKFEPGTSWNYGINLEYVGLLIEHFTGITLNDYVQENIFKPLGLNTTTFRYGPEIESRLSETSERLNGTTTFTGSVAPMLPLHPDADLGGAGLWSNAQDYVKILSDLLKKDSKVLGKKGKDLLFTPTLNLGGRKALYNTLWHAELGPILHGPSLPYGTKVDHGLGGMVLAEDVKGRRRKGTLSWVGLPNVYWFVDRKAGRALFWATQILPGGDQTSGDAFVRFEKAVYAAQV